MRYSEYKEANTHTTKDICSVGFAILLKSKAIVLNNRRVANPAERLR
jgi:hypothetical protein